jgi:hypothetical protein
MKEKSVMSVGALFAPVLSFESLFAESDPGLQNAGEPKLGFSVHVPKGSRAWDVSRRVGHIKVEIAVQIFAKSESGDIDDHREN